MTEMVTAFVGLGSNLDSPSEQILRALDEIAALPETKFLAASRLYHSEPMGPKDQPDYVNAVAAVDTHLAPRDLLNRLHDIEREHGRVRDESQRWRERVLDLDLLLYGDEMIDQDDLKVPHPGLAEREFVVFPLLDLAADLVMEIEIPGLGKLHHLADDVPLRGLKPLD